MLQSLAYLLLTNFHYATYFFILKHASSFPLGRLGWAFFNYTNNLFFLISSQITIGAPNNDVIALIGNVNSLVGI